MSVDNSLFGNFSDDLIGYLFEFLDDRAFIKSAEVCGRWWRIRTDIHVCKNRFSALIQSKVDFQKFKTQSGEDPHRFLIIQTKKRTLSESPVFPYVLTLFKKFDTVPSNLHWCRQGHHLSAESLKINVEGDCCSSIQPSDPNLIGIKREECLFEFNPQAGSVRLQYEGQTPREFSIQHPNATEFPTPSNPYFNGEKTAVINVGAGLFPKYAITIFDNVGQLTHDFEVSSATAVVLDSQDLCWVFLQGTSFRIWNISNPTKPTSFEVYNFEDELNAISPGPYGRDVVLAEIDTSQSKIAIALEDGTVSVIDMRKKILKKPELTYDSNYSLTLSHTIPRSSGDNLMLIDEL